MKKSSFLSALLVALFACFSALTAVADKLCLKTTVDKKTLKAKHQSALAANCPPGYAAIADSGYFVGPKGETGLVGPTGAQGGAGVTGSSGPQGAVGEVRSLYDSSNVKVGPVINIGCQQFFSDNQRKPIERVSVLVTIGGLTFPACASLDEFVGTSDVAFANTGCTGQAYLFLYSVPSTGSTLFTAGVVTGSGSHRIVYRPDYVTGASSVTRRSVYNSEGVCSDSTATETLFPAILVANLTSTYSAPLEVR